VVECLAQVLKDMHDMFAGFDENGMLRRTPEHMKGLFGPAGLQGRGGGGSGDDSD
jgi:hypothetical protein